MGAKPDPARAKLPISCCMRCAPPPVRVSHETIHRFAYSKDARAEQSVATGQNTADAAGQEDTGVNKS
ncbi:hypothetical protein ROLI_001720 [Roseobacter fucihabitans]|uniref:Uncharacterized protein n=1 Tax=Roseobacter fucihabitans TaxID=1537242 RepID=A0ABZ2BLV9_9RHOB|nr:hypothetical protein [Roseobacter litoralis]